MAKRHPNVPRLSAIRVAGLVFDRTRPEQLECASYILAAPFGQRQARIKRLLIEGHQAMEARKAANKNR